MVARNRRLSRQQRTDGLVLERSEGEEIVIQHGDDVLRVWLDQVRHGKRVRLRLLGSQQFRIVRRELLGQSATDAA